ncbi:MAG: hypothetical protein ABEJ91_01495 [Candidatus Nanohaloarchaea archaeon]
MSASEQSCYSLEEIVERVMNDEPMRYGEIVDEVSARRGTPVSPSNVRQVLEDGEDYVPVIWRGNGEQVEVAYRSKAT